MTGFLGLSLATIYLICIFLGALNILWAILSALLASKRGRSTVSWFFLGGIYGLLGFILLLLAGELPQGEKDSMSRILWILVIFPIAFFIFLALFAADATTMTV